MRRVVPSPHCIVLDFLVALADVAPYNWMFLTVCAYKFGIHSQKESFSFLLFEEHITNTEKTEEVYLSFLIIFLVVFRLTV